MASVSAKAFAVSPHDFATVAHPFRGHESFNLWKDDEPQENPNRRRIPNTGDDNISVVFNHDLDIALIRSNNAAAAATLDAQKQWVSWSRKLWLLSSFNDQAPVRLQRDQDITQDLQDHIARTGQYGLDPSHIEAFTGPFTAKAGNSGLPIVNQDGHLVSVQLGDDDRGFYVYGPKQKALLDFIQEHTR